ncbi:LCR-like protein [Medicago truncatula]|uniref:LCR-like protein n=1 Tax=Medicago truncatula TaxID=3880 RepID=A0A072UGD0_MEDTR|nr:LCR-like protein [Medicago truncatula]KEH24830.1 LCR-like protein [Medicago truncatula]
MATYVNLLLFTFAIVCIASYVIPGGVAEFLHCHPMETCPGSNDVCDTYCKTTGHHEGGGCLNVSHVCCCIG